MAIDHKRLGLTDTQWAALDATVAECKARDEASKECRSSLVRRCVQLALAQVRKELGLSEEVGVPTQPE